MRKSRRDFRIDTNRSPFELELDHPKADGRTYVVFKDVNKLPTKDVFALSRNEDPEAVLRLILSEEDFEAFWAEWAEVPADETTKLIEEVMNHYGADKGK